MKIIQTKYKGYNFRSRLEARWAVFFDSLGIKWEYEKEGFDLGNGIYYLPDFWLPEVGLWAEVKPEEFNEKEIEKAERLVFSTEKGLIKLIGVPELKTYNIITCEKDITSTQFNESKPNEKKFYIQEGEWYPLEFKTEKKIEYGEIVLSQWHNYPKSEKRFYSYPSDEDFETDMFDDTKDAIKKSRSKRFEFGEN